MMACLSPCYFYCQRFEEQRWMLGFLGLDNRSHWRASSVSTLTEKEGMKCLQISLLMFKTRLFSLKSCISFPYFSFTISHNYPNSYSTSLSSTTLASSLFQSSSLSDRQSSPNRQSQTLSPFPSLITPNILAKVVSASVIKPDSSSSYSILSTLKALFFFTSPFWRSMIWQVLWSLLCLSFMWVQTAGLDLYYLPQVHWKRGGSGSRESFGESDRAWVIISICKSRIIRMACRFDQQKVHIFFKYLLQATYTLLLHYFYIF